LDSSRRAAETGTTTLLNIVSDPAALAGLAGTLPRVWWALELIDLHEDPQPAVQLDRLSAWLSRHPGCPWHAALSPHAPYTASPRLYRDAARLAQDLRLPFTTHWAESVEEKELFTSGRGPLRALLPDQWTAGNLADRASALPTGSLLAHANHLSDADLAAFAQRRCFVVHCPTTHRWLGRDPFPLEKFRAARIPVLLGTDSPASSNNSSFDLRVEARSLLQSHPSLPPAEIWSMLTTLPASALGQAERLGSLTPGAQADFVAWRLPPTPPTPRPHPHPATPTPPAPRPTDPAIPAILASTGPAEIISVAGHLHRPETPQSP
jgi:cytosine/adenosine deaminase-related metal-dependent hydrolase